MLFKVFFYFFFSLTCFLLFLDNLKQLRIVLLSTALGLLIFNSYLFINYLVYNFYFDSLFIIFKIKNISFFNFFYIMYDGISLILIFLTLILYLVSIVASQNMVTLNILMFLLNIVILFVILCFVIYDLFIFYILFEALLIPMFLIIVLYGSRERKIIAAYKFFLYTFIGSISFFIYIFDVQIKYNTFNLQYLLFYTTDYFFFYNKFFQLLLFLTFAIKVPLYPLHSQLPEAHTEAPTVGSIILAGILLKLGPYGLWRFINVLFFYGAFYQRPFIYVLCLLSLYYTSIIAIRQVDLKKIIAYSSISHMALVILGLYSFTFEGILGAFYLMLSHGFVSGGLFYIIGCLYERYKTRIIFYYGGVAQVNPQIAFFCFLFLLGNISFPFTLNFLAEILILLGLVQVNLYLVFLVSFSSLFILTYNLFFFTKIFFGLFTNLFKVSIYENILIEVFLYKEYFVCVILLFPIFFQGIFSDFLLKLHLKSIIFFLNGNFFILQFLNSQYTIESVNYLFFI